MPLTPEVDPRGRTLAPVTGGRVVWMLAAGLLLVHALLAWYLRTPGIGTGNDDAVYLLLSRALRHGSYADLFYAGLPTESQYPPLYPAFLALLSSIAGERVTLLLAANVLLSVTGLALLFDVARRRDPLAALLTLALVVINPLLLGLAGGLRSEPLCMALTGVSLWLLANPAPGRRALCWAGAAAVGAALTRSAAVTLVAGVGLWWLHQRRWRAVAVLGLTSAVTVGSWLVWTVVAPRQLPGRSYVADLTLGRDVAGQSVAPPRAAPAEQGDSRPPVQASEAPGTPATTPTAPGAAEDTAPPTGTPPSAAPATVTLATPGPADTATAPEPEPAGLMATLGSRLKTNIPAYAATLLATIGVPTIPDTRLDNAAWALLLTVLGAIGLWGLARWWMVAVLTLACHALLLALWPYALARYLAPLLPLIVLAVFLGARRAGEWSHRRLPRAVPRQLLPLVLATGILAGAVPRTVGQVAATSRCRAEGGVSTARCGDPVERAFFEAVGYISRSTPDTARFFTAKEGPFYYYTGRQVVPIYQVAAGQVTDLPEYLSRHGAEYVFLSHLKSDEWALARPLLAMCRRLEVVRTWGPATVLLQRAGEGTTGNDACGAIRAYALEPWGDRQD